MVDIIAKVVTTDTATLAAVTAVELGTFMTGLKEAILLTMVQISGPVFWGNLADKCLIGLAYGDVTIAQIAASLTLAETDFEENTLYRENQVKERFIIDVHAPEVPGTGQANHLNWKPRLPKGGLPAGKGGGFKFFAFNADSSSAFTNGPNFRCHQKFIFARIDK